jgi:hypothetical protein
MMETDGAFVTYAPPQAMAASLSSLDLEQGATVTAREGQAGSTSSAMASMAPAGSEHITPDESGEEGRQGVAFDDMAPSMVRALLIPARGDMLNRGETVVA